MVASNTARVGESDGEMIRLADPAGEIVGCLLVKRIVSFHAVPEGSRIHLADGHHVVVGVHIRDTREAIHQCRMNIEPTLPLVAASWYGTK